MSIALRCTAILAIAFTLLTTDASATLPQLIRPHHIAFSDDFSNNSGWTDTSGTSVIDADIAGSEESAWFPAADSSGKTSSSAVFPEINLTRGNISIYFRARTDNPVSGYNGALSVSLRETSTNLFIDATIQPGQKSKIRYTTPDSSEILHTTGSMPTTFADTTSYETFRLVITDNRTGTVDAHLLQLNAITGAYFELVSALNIQTGSARYSKLSVMAKNKSARAYIDSISIAQTRHLIGFQSAFAKPTLYPDDNYDSIGLYNDAIFLSSWMLDAPAATWVTPQYFNSKTVEALAATIGGHTGGVIPTDYSGVIVLDIEAHSTQPIHPKNWPKFVNDDDRYAVFDGFRKRVDAVRLRYPQAEITLYGFPTLTANPSETNQTYMAQLAEFQAAAVFGVFDEVDVISPVMYFRKGPDEHGIDILKAQLTNYANHSIGLAAQLTKSNGSPLRLLPIFSIDVRGEPSKGAAITKELAQHFYGEVDKHSQLCDGYLWWGANTAEDNGGAVSYPQAHEYFDWVITEMN